MIKRRWIQLLGMFSVVGLTGCEAKEQTSSSQGVWDFAFVHPLIALLDWFHRWLGNYGGAIVVGTLLFRMWFLPLVLKGLKQSSTIRKWKGKAVALLEKSKHPRTAAPFLRLFFPLLYQIPVMMALYQVVQSDPHIGESRFLWMPLGQPDPWFFLPLVAGWTTTWQGGQELSVERHPGVQVLIALGVFVCALAVPSALSLYGLASNFSSRLGSNKKKHSALLASGYTGTPGY